MSDAKMNDDTPPNTPPRENAGEIDPQTTQNPPDPNPTTPPSPNDTLPIPGDSMMGKPATDLTNNSPTPPPPNPPPAQHGTDPTDHENKHDKDNNTTEYPPPGCLLGRVIGGAQGSIKVKLIPTDKRAKPFIRTYTKPIHPTERFRRHCPIIAEIDNITGDITRLKEELDPSCWDQFYPIPGIIASVSEHQDGQIGLERGEITAFTNKLHAPFTPTPNTRILFWSAVTTRMNKRPGTRYPPRQERYIDVVHLDINKEPLRRNERDILFPPLLKHLTDTLSIDIEIGASPLTTTPNSYGALQSTTTHKHALLDIIAHIKRETDRALAQNTEHAQAARKLKRAFDKPIPTLNILIKPRMHLSYTIQNINEQLHKSFKLRSLISNIFLILPADPQTDHTNPYHNNPQILTALNESINNYASHIHHINQPTFEGSYDLQTGTTTHKRAKDLKTYNIIRFTPTPNNAFISPTKLHLPKPTLLHTSSFTDETDGDASDEEPPLPTNYIHVSYPTEDKQRANHATHALTHIYKKGKGKTHIESMPSPHHEWQMVKIEPGESNDRKAIINQLTASDALLLAMDEDKFADAATDNYLLLARPGVLAHATAIACLRAPGFAEDATKTSRRPPPPQRGSSPTMHCLSNRLSTSRQLQTNCKFLQTACRRRSLSSSFTMPPNYTHHTTLNHHAPCPPLSHQTMPTAAHHPPNSPISLSTSAPMPPQRTKIKRTKWLKTSLTTLESRNVPKKRPNG